MIDNPSPAEPGDEPTATSAPASPASLGRIIAAGAVGVFVEYYDYAAYGLVAGTIAAIFFAPGDQTAALLLTYGIFAITFAVRPVGGIVLGHIADKLGRKSVMVFTLTMMAVATTLIGILPDYAAVGIAAPVLLLLLRLAQGFSAGGEMGSAMSFVGEWSAPERRARNLAWVHVGSYVALFFGTLLAFVLNVGLGASAMAAWGWRVVFLIAAPLGIIGFYIRSKLQETPSFKRLISTTEETRSPFREVVTTRGNDLAILRAILVPILNGAGYYVLFTYMPTYLKTNLAFSAGDSLLVTLAGISVCLVLIPVMGHLADRWGRRPMMLTSAILTLLVTLPAYSLMTLGSTWTAVLGAVILAASFSPQAGAVHTVLVELFATRVRTTGYSIGYNIATAIFGGAAPFIITWLISLTGSVASPAHFLMGTAVLSLIGLLILKESKGTVFTAN